MSYGLKYYFEFDAIFDTSFRVEMWKDGYTGDAKKLSIGASPEMDVEEEQDGVRASSLKLSLQAETNGALYELYTTNNKEWLVKEYATRGNSMSLIWQGYVLPELYSESWVDAPYDVNVTAVDGLGLLKFIPFTPTATRRTLIDIMQGVLNNTGLDLPFHILSSLSDKTLSGTIYEQVTVHDSMFDGKNCYEVMQDIMVATGATITQLENRWLIRRWMDVDLSSAVEVANGNTTVVPMHQYTLGSVGKADTFPVGSLDMEIDPAMAGADFSFKYINGKSLFKNPEMTTDSDWEAFGEVDKPGTITLEDGTKEERQMYVLRERYANIQQTVPAIINDVTLLNLDIDALPSFFGEEGDDLGGNVTGRLQICVRSSVTNKTDYVHYYFLAYDQTENKASWKIVTGIDADGNTIIQRSYFTIDLETLVSPYDIIKEDLNQVQVQLPPLPKTLLDQYGEGTDIHIEIMSDSRVWKTENEVPVTKASIPVYVGGVYLLPDQMPEGYERNVVVNANATEQGSVEVPISDSTPLINGEHLLYNAINSEGSGSYISTQHNDGLTFWETFQVDWLDKYANKRMILNGTISAVAGPLPVLIKDNYSNKLFAVASLSWTQEAHEWNVKLEEVGTSGGYINPKDTFKKSRKTSRKTSSYKGINSLTTTAADSQSSVVIDDGQLKMLVEEDARVLVSGELLGTNDPAPLTTTVLQVNTALATTTSTDPVTIDRTFTILTVEVPAVGANILLPAITLSTSLTGRGVYNLQVYLGWNNTGLKDSFVKLTSSTASVTIPPIVLTTTEAVGTSQTLTLHVSGTFAPASLTTSILKLTTTADEEALVSTPFKIVEMARNGFRAAYSANRMFSLEYNENTGDLLMTHKGSMDIPGVLLWGSVDNTGSALSSGGFYYGNASKQSDGSYRITHSIGHQLYTVIAPGCTVVARGVDYIDITTEADTAFDFMILGNNDNIKTTTDTHLEIKTSDGLVLRTSDGKVLRVINQ